MSTSLEAISAAARADGLPWVDLGVGGPFLLKGLHFCRRTCFRGPKTCRGLAGWQAGCGDADLRVNRGHDHFDLHVFQGSQDVPRAGWLAGCGGADLRVNRGHEHFDLHVFQGSQDVPRWWER